MHGPKCPVHGKPMDLLSTTNEWIYYCDLCDKRYNKHLEEMTLQERRK